MSELSVAQATAQLERMLISTQAAFADTLVEQIAGLRHANTATQPDWVVGLTIAETLISSVRDGLRADLARTHR